jgi:ubiquinone/menaquinone biosynthesis C-methylase UbiE
MGIDYTTVTEVPGSRVTLEQLERMSNRYYFASKFCEGRDVLEVACGAGQGLGYLAKKARKVFGGDCTANLINIAQRYYKGSIPVLHLDAHTLPFQDNTFDVVILYEAIYYLVSPDEFFKECSRVLRSEGVVLICTVNKEWVGFNPSPFSTQYFSAAELHSLLSKHNFDVWLFGDSPVSSNSLKEKFTAAIRRIAVALNLIPKTMKGKEIFKRLFYGQLLYLKEEIEDGMAEYCDPIPIDGDLLTSNYKVLFAIARCKADKV